MAAGSVSLIGFGLDSAIEVSAAVVLAWRLRHERGGGCMQESDRPATRGTNALLGRGWADPLAGLAIAGLAGAEAVKTWRAESLADTCCN